MKGDVSDFSKEETQKEAAITELMNVGAQSEREVARKSVLVVQTAFDLYVMDLNHCGCEYESWDPLKKDDLKLPPLLSSLNFADWGFPIGMGSLKRGDAVYMFGGEHFEAVEKGIEPSLIAKLDGGISSEILTWNYKESFRDPILIRNMVPQLKAGKAKPVVELIHDDKIFVHHSSRGYFFKEFDHPDPVFEYYDPLKRDWVEVADAPYVKKEFDLVKLPPYTAYNHFVIGNLLFIKSNCRFLNCYDMSFLKWEEKIAEDFMMSFQKASLRPPSSGRCVSVPGFICDVLGVNLFVCLQFFTRFCPQMPFAHLIRNNGELLCSQNLSEDLFKDFLPYTNCFVESCFIDLGGGNVCAIMYGQEKDELFAEEVDEFFAVLHICFFKLEKLPDADIKHMVASPPPGLRGKFLNVKVNKKYFCKLDGYYRSPCLRNAFFLEV